MNLAAATETKDKTMFYRSTEIFTHSRSWYFIDQKANR